MTQMLENIRDLVLAPPANCERFHVVFLDRNRSYLGVSYFAAGRLDSYTLRLRELFARALSLDARSMIVAHNHPSGDCRPSDHDIRATQQVATQANALEIELIDHLIFTTSQVYSMRGRVTL